MAKLTLQAAAIPWRDGRICMVTSKSGRRWVVPKGRIEIGHTPQEAAAAEAWEEAGLKGRLGNQSLGTYRYEKFGAEFTVSVYLMHVDSAADDWPEVEVREREWVGVEEALSRIEEADLRKLIRTAVAELSMGV